MRILMVGVDEKTKGGMWSVVRNYLQSDTYLKNVSLKYVPIATVGSILRKMLFFVVRFAQIFLLLLAKNWDIVHIHMSERGSVYRKLLIARMAKLFQCRVVLHMHGAEFETWYMGLPNSRKEWVKNGLNDVDTILILGEYWKTFVSSLIDEKEKIKVLYNAVSVPETNRYQDNASNLLFLGEVGERKGVYDLLKALEMIDKQLDDNCQLSLYGTNPDGDIVNRIEEKKLQHRVRYMGWADSTQLEKLFTGIAVNILPSYHEGLPMTILETMAQGIPNITTDIAAISEAVYQKNGILICPGDIKELANAIIYLLKNPDVRNAMSEDAYQTVKKRFSIERHMLEVLKIYEETMN